MTAEPTPISSPALPTSPGGESLDVVASPQRARMLLGAAMLASIAVYAWLWEAPLEGGLFLVGVGATVLVARSAFTLVAALGWGLLGNLAIEWPDLFVDDRLRLDDWFSTMALLAFALFGCRCLEVQNPPFRRTRAPIDANNAPLPRVVLCPWLGVASRVALVPVVAMMLLWLAPWQAMTDNSARVAPSAYRMLVFFWGVVGIGLLASAAFAALKWRRLTPIQARLYARWVLLDELRRDQAAIERARRRRQQRTRG